MKQDRIRAALSLAANLCLIAFTAVPLCGLLASIEGTGGRLEVFRYYTTLSNVLAAAVAVPTAIRALRSLVSGSFALPKPLAFARFAVSCALTLTMMTVLCFLGPVLGYGGMFSGVNFWFHLVNPLLSVFAFCFLETDPALRKRTVFPAILPTALYGIFYIRFAVLLGEDRGGWPDFYGLNIGGFWVLSVFAMLAADAGFAFLLLLIHNRAGKRTRDPSPLVDFP